MATALERTYEFTNVSFTCGGRDCAVSSIRLTLRQNGIPEARVVVDPAHGPSDAVRPATKATLGVITAWHTEFEGYAKEKASATLKFTAKSKLDTQDVSLTGWVVTAAGITGASAKGNFALEITIQHPATALDENVMHVGSLAKQAEASIQSYGDPLMAIKDLLRRYGQARRLPAAKTCGNSPAAALQQSPDTAINKARRDLVTLSTDLTKYLEWDSTGSNWPCQNGCLDVMLPQICNTMYGYLTGLDQHTMWELISARLSTDFHLEVLPTFWEDKLKLRPAQPWGKPEYTIYDDEISDLTYPGVDPAPLGGVSAQMEIATSGDYSVLLGQEGDRHQMLTEALYLPPDVISGKAKGRVILVDAPSWLSCLGSVDAAAAGGVTAPGPKESNHNQLRTPGNTPRDHQPEAVSGPAYTQRQEKVKGALYYYAHGMFLLLYRQGVQTEVRTRLLLKPTGGPEYLTAGYCCSLESREDGTVFDFCIETVIHSIDFQAGTAGTEIYGRYCRPPTGFEGMAYMAGGTPNPMY
jgi:hypothetical protein